MFEKHVWYVTFTDEVGTRLCFGVSLFVGSCQQLSIAVLLRPYMRTRRREET